MCTCQAARGSAASGCIQRRCILGPLSFTMWGRIADIAAQADAIIGGDDEGSQSRTEEGDATSAEEGGALQPTDEDLDGWGEDDGWGDDEFDEEVGEEPLDDDMTDGGTADGLKVPSVAQPEPAAAATTSIGASAPVDPGDVINEEEKEMSVEQPSSSQSAAQPIHQQDLVTVSAPGKALVAGGYLVLEAPNPGVVLPPRAAASTQQLHSDRPMLSAE